MDLQQTKILLEKINGLHRSVSLNKGPVAPIERDLMLSYIRQLYELYLDAEVPVPTVKPKPEPVAEAPKIALKSQEIEPPKPVYMPPKVVEAPKPVLREEPIVVKEVPPPPPVIPAYQPTYTAPVNNPAPPPAPKLQPRPAASGNKDYTKLFDFRKSNDLSERLSDRPVSDLTKAFAINDRLLYINELFGKDADSFNESLKLLNKFERMDEAKSLLISLADQYDWSQEERLEIAQSFVKTVRRKYA